MILEKLIVGALGTNCYIFGSDKTKEVVIIDPGAEPNEIIKRVEQLEAKPSAVLLTHGHFDHTQRVGKILRHFEIPLMFNKKEYDSKIYTQKEAKRWLKEGDTIQVGEIILHVLETPGHSPGSLSFYSIDVKELKGKKVDGVIFTGDLLFRRSIGRSDFEGGDQRLLFKSIREKIMQSSIITDNFVVLSGHMGITTVGEERNYNSFKKYFT